jgi:hypothetical protein
MAEAFLASQAAQDYPLSSTQLNALAAFLLDEAFPVSEAAKNLTEPIVDAFKKDANEFDCDELWRTITDAVKKLTDMNDRLVQLVVEIQKIHDAEGGFTSMQGFNEHLTEFAFDCTSLPNSFS